MDEPNDLIEIRGDDGKLLFKLSRDGTTAFVKVREIMYIVDLVSTVSSGLAAARRVNLLCFDKNVSL